MRHFFKLSLLLILFSSTIVCNADTNRINSIDNQKSIEKSIDSKINFSSEQYYSKDSKLERISKIGISRIEVNKKNINIQYAHESDFIEVYAMLRNGIKENVTDIITWNTTNFDVAYGEQGRIFGANKGNAVLTLSLLGYKEKINVKVINSFDFDLVSSSKNSPRISNYAAASLRETVVAKAKKMVNLTWKPTKNLVKWKGFEYFTANIAVTGIPYTQAVQKDDVSFITSMGYSDFYTSYTSNGVIMPRYGNDCSGFLSFAWGISRKTTLDFSNGIKNGTYKKVGNYNPNSLTSAALTESYKYLKPGDALVYRNSAGGHTFIVVSNDTTNSKVYVYEQTPPKAISATWTYSKLASGSYMPFTLTYMDNNVTPAKLEPTIK